MPIHLNKELKKLPDHEIPDGLHPRIVRKVFFRYLLSASFPLILLLGTNLVISGWWAGMKLREMETFSVARVLLDGFEFSTSFVSDFATTLLNVLPIFSLAVFLINLIAIVYAIRTSQRVRKLSTLPSWS